MTSPADRAVRVCERRELSEGWELAAAAPGVTLDVAELDTLEWRPAAVPGTVAGAVADLSVDPDDFDWWFRTTFDAPPRAPGQRLVLRFGGIATLGEVFLNGRRILSSSSMFLAHEVDVSDQLASSNELAICCRALAPELRVRRRPRARWRTSLVDGNLRFFRTMLMGRIPGSAPGPAVVGPWRPIALERRGPLFPTEVRMRARIEGDGAGTLRVRVALPDDPADRPAALTVSVSGPESAQDFSLALTAAGGQLVAEAELRLASVAPWWPHTHGRPTLYRVRLSADDQQLHETRVGFRSVTWPPDWEEQGFALTVNGVATFARGAVWTPLDLRAPHQPSAALRPILERVVTAGMNMLRVPGTGCYESDDFYDLCDELGILVWQDFMLANLDYPASESAWLSAFELEVRQLLGRLAGRPSTAALCGGSEVAQQPAMLGLDAELSRAALYTSVLPRLIDDADADAAYIPNAPWGGELPFRPANGVANYYGVGAYLRDLTDARLAGVRFASECLAFSNVPDDVTLDLLQATEGLAPSSPDWKRAVPRDAGAGWDFEDVRDHYLEQLFGEGPTELRTRDPRRYVELSRIVTGEVMAAVFGEWRRPASRCQGGLVLWLKDLVPGAGWGIIDSAGYPKAAYHYLRRALAPVAVWLTEEGLNGMAVHVANDRPEPLTANLRLTLYRDLQVPVERGTIALSVPAHGSFTGDVESLLGHFVDVGYAYRFGPPGHDVVVASLELGPQPGEGLLANAFCFPIKRPSTRETTGRLELSCRLEPDEQHPMLRLRSARLAHAVRIHVPGFAASDDAFSLEPGVERVVELRGDGSVNVAEASIRVTAINMAGALTVD